MARDTLVKKTAYAALGVPVHVAARVRERIEDVRRAVEEAGERLSEEAQKALDEWVDEGERIVSSLTDRVRGRTEELEATVRGRAATARDVGRGVAATLTEPIAPIEKIDGIGPGYADKLGNAGIISTRALVERCDTPAAIDRLAEQTGISSSLIEKWVAAADLTRIDGVGDEYMSLLNRAGIATIASLAASDAADLHRRSASLNDELRIVAATPSTATVRSWIDRAGALERSA